jgi:predicted Fe-Mo cluster-binding NifX family protein
MTDLIPNSMIVAVPSELDGGLDAPRSGHFGHAPGFTLVTITDGVPGPVRTIENPPHTSGGCMGTVNILAAAEVTAVVAAGMGGGPLGGLRSAGIEVYFEDSEPTVRGAVDAVLTGRIVPFGGDHVCRGHH